MVYSWPGKTLLLTTGITKEAQIFWVSFCGSSTPGMAVLSTNMAYPIGRPTNLTRFQYPSRRTLGVDFPYFPQGLVQPPVPRRSPYSPVEFYSGTLIVCPKISSTGSYCCDYGGRLAGHLSTLSLISQYHFLALWQPLVPSGGLPWHPRGLPHVVPPPSRPRPRFVDSLSCVFFCCDGINPPMQMVP